MTVKEIPPDGVVIPSYSESMKKTNPQRASSPRADESGQPGRARAAHAPCFRALTLIAAGNGRPDRVELLRLQERDEIPRMVLYEDTVHSDMLNDEYLRSAPPFIRFLARLLPLEIVQAVEAYRVRRRYDIVITWNARLAIAYSVLLRLTGSRWPHMAMLSWVSKGSKAKLLRRFRGGIDHLVLWSTEQRDAAVRTLGFRPEAITLVGRRADTRFWRPMSGPTDMICAVGYEQRDYATFLEALRSFPVRCHVATGMVQGKPAGPTIHSLVEGEEHPAALTVGPKNYRELRDLYARSRFVVVPLFDTDTDNGATVIEESMAMGKAVICTRTRGQRDLVVDGVNGLYVPPGDPAALREAMERLWNDPELAERMGGEGRKLAETRHSLDLFVSTVHDAALGTVLKAKARGTKW